MQKNFDKKFSFAILVYPCTLVAYLRIALLVWATLLLYSETSTGQDVLAITLLGISCILDAVDGHFARRFGHVTAIGAVLDQLIDLAIQSVLWLSSGFVFAIPLMLLEWFAGGLVFNKAVIYSANWKNQALISANRWAAYYFARQQRNPLSLAANISHTVFPMALILGPGWIWLAYLSAPGLLIFTAATLFIIVSLLRRSPGGCDRYSGMQ